MLNLRLGRFEEAEPYARRSMNAATRLGPAHHDVLKFRGLLATILMKLNRLDEADSLVHEQYDLCIEHLGPTHADTLQAITLQYDLAEAHADLPVMRRWAEKLRGTQWEEAVNKQVADFERKGNANP